MKRIQEACICQTLLFAAKDGFSLEEAASLCAEEVKHYKLLLERRGIRYKIVDEAPQPDGTIRLKIIKQYNNADTGSYLD